VTSTTAAHLQAEGAWCGPRTVQEGRQLLHGVCLRVAPLAHVVHGRHIKVSRAETGHSRQLALPAAPIADTPGPQSSSTLAKVEVDQIPDIAVWQRLTGVRVQRHACGHRFETSRKCSLFSVREGFTAAGPARLHFTNWPRPFAYMTA